PILPHVFMTAETDPAKSAPMSSGTAQETPTVSSNPKNARQLYQTHAVGLLVMVAGTMKAAAITKPKIATPRRANFKLPDRLAQMSESHPPSRSPPVPASRGRLE